MNEAFIARFEANKNTSNPRSVGLFSVAKPISFGELGFFLDKIPDFVLEIKDLKYFGIRDTNISDISPVMKLNKLNTLHLYGNRKITAIPFSKGVLPELKILTIDASIGDISPLLHLENLKTLVISGMNSQILGNFSNAKTLNSLLERGCRIDLGGLIFSKGHHFPESQGEFPEFKEKFLEKGDYDVTYDMTPEKFLNIFYPQYSSEGRTTSNSTT